MIGEQTGLYRFTLRGTVINLYCLNTAAPLSPFHLSKRGSLTQNRRLTDHRTDRLKEAVQLVMLSRITGR